MGFDLQQKKVLIIAVSIFSLLSALYFLGFSKPIVKKGERDNNEEEKVLTEAIVLSEARSKLDSSQMVFLAELDREINNSESLDAEANVYKLLSRTWFEYKNYLVSGFYAKKAAEIINDAEAWSIAGTTYGAAFTASNDNAEKKLAANASIEALTTASKLDSSNIQHAMNIGLMYLELSTVDASVMPMKGVRMLQELERKNPDNVMINMTLGRLSMTRTGDLEKARPRFEKIIALSSTQDVDNALLLEAHYFLIECYKATDDIEKVKFHFDSAIKLAANNPAVQEELLDQKNIFLNNN